MRRYPCQHRLPITVHGTGCHQPDQGSDQRLPLPSIPLRALLKIFQIVMNFFTIFCHHTKSHIWEHKAWSAQSMKYPQGS